MAVNITEFMTDPWGNTFAVFTDLLGTPFWLIPLSVVAAALWMKTKDPAIVSLYMITTGGLLLTGNLFIGVMDMVMFYGVFTAVGIGSLFIELFLSK